MNPYVRLPKVPIVNDRQALILDRCRGKRVLHLGCVDAGLLYERFQRQELMHQRLAVIASDLWGVDIDLEGISFLRSHGFDKLSVGDICKLEKIEALQGQSFDVVVASEVIEHLDNPGMFLKSVKSLMIPNETELIISVPNAFRIDTLTWLLRGVEYVHPDHNYWFSYHTATNLVQKNGFEIKEVYVYSFQRLEILPDVSTLFSKRRKEDRIAEFDTTSDSYSISILGRAFSYLRSFPKALLMNLLYKRTCFWGDGIIIVTQRRAHD